MVAASINGRAVPVHRHRGVHRGPRDQHLHLGPDAPHQDGLTRFAAELQCVRGEVLLTDGVRCQRGGGLRVGEEGLRRQSWFLDESGHGGLGCPVQSDRGLLPEAGPSGGNGEVGEHAGRIGGCDRRDAANLKPGRTGNSLVVRRPFFARSFGEAVRLTLLPSNSEHAMPEKVPFAIVKEEYFRPILKENLPEPQKVKRLASLLRRYLEKDDALDLLEDLDHKIPGLPISREFHERLSAKARSDLLAVIRDIAERGRPGTWPAPWEDNGHLGTPAPRKIETLRRLVDEDNGRERMVAMDDPDILDRYIDYNIKNVTSDYNQLLDARTTMVVHYQNGKSLSFAIANVPVTYQWPKGVHLVRINRRPYGGSTASYFLRRGGFIYPVDADGNVLLNTSDTPNLVKFRSSIEEYMRRGKQLVQIAELVNTFASQIALLAGFASLHPQNHSWILSKLPPPSDELNVRPLARTRGKPAGGGKPPGAAKPTAVTKAAVRGKPDATDPQHAAREQHSADTYAKDPHVKEVFLGAEAKKKFGSPAAEKFPDVVAEKKDGSFALGEGKGTDMNKAVKQFEAAGKRIGRPISEQHVVVERITIQQGERSPGPGHRVDARNFLERFSEATGAWEPVYVNGKPILVIEVSAGKP